MCNGYDGKRKEKHDWHLIGCGYTGEIESDIVCLECGLTKTVHLENSDKTRKVIEKILDNNNKFIIPRDIFLYSE